MYGFPSFLKCSVIQHEMCKFFEFGIFNRCNNFVCSVVLSIPALLSHQMSLEKSLLLVAIYRLEVRQRQDPVGAALYLDL